MKKVSRKAQVKEVRFAGPIWVGVDVHKNSYAVAIRDNEGRGIQFTMSSDNEAFVKKIQEYNVPIGLVAYEAGPCGYSLYRACLAAGIRVIVAAPSKMPRPVTRGNKTDRLDCRKLAEYAARDMLVAVCVPSKDEQALRSLQRRRHTLTDHLREAKQQIKGLLLENHYTLPSGLDSFSKASLAYLQVLDLPAGVRDVLDSLLRELNFLQAERAQVDQAIAQARPRHIVKRMDNLQSVPGVGPVLATTFVCEIFRPERFANGERLSSYVGLAPVVRQSGESAAKGYLVRTGQQRLRSLLVECAWLHKGRDAASEALYRRVLQRTGTVQKAIVAVARRLLVLLWRLSVENRAYTVA